MSITSTDDGIILDLGSGEYRKSRAAQDGVYFWDLQNQAIILEELGDFLPRVSESHDKPSVRFSKIVNGQEVCGESQIARRIPKSEARRVQTALKRLQSRLDDPRIAPHAAQVIRGFKLPDPRRMPECYRLYGSGLTKRLIILWGFERASVTSVPANGNIQSPERNPVWKNKWFLIFLAHLLVVLLISVRCWEDRLEDHSIHSSDSESEHEVMSSMPPEESNENQSPLPPEESSLKRDEMLAGGETEELSQEPGSKTEPQTLSSKPQEETKSDLQPDPELLIGESEEQTREGAAQSTQESGQAVESESESASAYSSSNLTDNEMEVSPSDQNLKPRSNNLLADLPYTSKSDANEASESVSTKNQEAKHYVKKTKDLNASGESREKSGPSLPMPDSASPSYEPPEARLSRRRIRTPGYRVEDPTPQKTDVVTLEQYYIIASPGPSVVASDGRVQIRLAVERVNNISGPPSVLGWRVNSKRYEVTSNEFSEYLAPGSYEIAVELENSAGDIHESAIGVIVDTVTSGSFRIQQRD